MLEEYEIYITLERPISEEDLYALEFKKEVKIPTRGFLGRRKLVKRYLEAYDLKRVGEMPVGYDRTKIVYNLDTKEDGDEYPVRIDLTYNPSPPSVFLALIGPKERRETLKILMSRILNKDEKEAKFKQKKDLLEKYPEDDLIKRQYEDWKDILEME